MIVDKNNLYSSSMFELIDNVVEVVVNTYFYWVEDYQLREDLMQEGYLKAYELLKTGNYDPNQSLRNYIYTGVRNTMSNYMYHSKKEKHSSYDVYNDNVETEFDNNYIMSTTTFTDPVFDVDLIQNACDKFNSNYIGNAINYFNSLGMNMENNYTIVDSPNNLMLKAIIVECLWNL